MQPFVLPAGCKDWLEEIERLERLIYNGHSIEDNELLLPLLDMYNKWRPQVKPEKGKKEETKEVREAREGKLARASICWLWLQRVGGVSKNSRYEHVLDDSGVGLMAYGVRCGMPADTAPYELRHGCRPVAEWSADRKRMSLKLGEVKKSRLQIVEAAKDLQVHQKILETAVEDIHGGVSLSFYAHVFLPVSEQDDISPIPAGLIVSHS